MDKINQQQLGEQLCALGYLNPAHLRLALVEQKLTGERLGDLLLKMGLVARDKLLSVIAEQQHLTIFNWQNFTVNEKLIKLFSEPQLRLLKIFPCYYNAENYIFTIATSEPNDLVKRDQINSILRENFTQNFVISYVLSDLQEIEKAINLFFGNKIDVASEIEQIESAIIKGTNPAMNRLTDLIIRDALAKKASDIHISPEANYLTINYRIDGILTSQFYLHLMAFPSLVSRIKIISGMNIAENRSAQDGKILFPLTNQDNIECRVSVQPTIHGENVVIRLLDRRDNVLQLEMLNFYPEVIAQIRQLLKLSDGILLLSGPTGCGKTTTLYSLISELNDTSVNIMTLEDPVEYQLKGIRQTSLAECKLDFATGVRALLRQDPDIILLGEIRDNETAQMALRAAMTGHKVLATVHSNSALDTISRLVDLGVNHRQVLGNIQGICNQRLIRKLCPHCKIIQDDQFTEQIIDWLQNNRWKNSSLSQTNSSINNNSDEKIVLSVNNPSSVIKLYSAKGCELCNFLGYIGRIPLIEICNLQFLFASQQVNSIEEIIEGKTFQSLLQNGIEVVLAGLSSFHELRRVVNCSNLPASLANYT